MEKYYYGYPLFQLSCHNHSLHVDIPLLLRFTSAKRHDSVSFLVAFHEFEKHETTLRIIGRIVGVQSTEQSVGIIVGGF